MIPTIKVIVTFSKFEELPPVDAFTTPPSSPSGTGRENREENQSSSSSWFEWIKAPYLRSTSSNSASSSKIKNMQDPFALPPDYTWVTAEAKKRRMQEKSRSKKARSQNP